MGPRRVREIRALWRASVQSVRGESEGVGMSTHPAARNRWMDWKPTAQILGETAESEPTKPAKPGFVGFEGATSGEAPEISAVQHPAELARAFRVLERTGVRIMALEAGATIGVWSDTDQLEVRAALRTLGLDRFPVRYLDGDGVPMCYKVRRVEGVPVPKNVLAEMERHPVDPWKVRDRMLNEMGTCSKGIPWAAWKAATLNELFRRHGTTEQPGHITAATVAHGEGQ